MNIALTDMSIQFEVLAVNVEVEALRNIHNLQVLSGSLCCTCLQLHQVWKVLASSLTSCWLVRCRSVWTLWRSRDISVHSIIKACFTLAPRAQNRIASIRTRDTLFFL